MNKNNASNLGKTKELAMPAWNNVLDLVILEEVDPVLMKFASEQHMNGFNKTLSLAARSKIKVPTKQQAMAIGKLQDSSIEVLKMLIELSLEGLDPDKVNDAMKSFFRGFEFAYEAIMSPEYIPEDY